MAPLDAADAAQQALSRLAAYPGGAYGGPVPGLAEALVAGFASARRRWPHCFDRHGEAFATYASEKLMARDDLGGALRLLRIDDLLLAWWAGSGDDRGIAAFEATYAELLANVVRRFHRLPPDELRQRLRIKLFVGDGAGQPGVRRYSGFGFLENWLRVTAVRVALDLAREHSPAGVVGDVADLDDDPAAFASASGDPRLAPFRDQLRGAAKRAFGAAVEGLTARERNFLRHVHVDHLTLEQIAALYQLHRATVARGLASARAKLVETTRAALARDLRVPADELASAIRLLDSGMDLSLSRVLAEPEADAEMEPAQA